jgi:hypothetical protein
LPGWHWFAPRKIRGKKAPGFQAVSDFLIVEFPEIFAVAIDVNHCHGQLA